MILGSIVPTNIIGIQILLRTQTLRASRNSHKKTVVQTMTKWWRREVLKVLCKFKVIQLRLKSGTLAQCIYPSYNYISHIYKLHRDM